VVSTYRFGSLDFVVRIPEFTPFLEKSSVKQTHAFFIFPYLPLYQRLKIKLNNLCDFME